MNAPPACYVCNQTDDEPGVEIRPYGPNGAWICFACMTADPEREAEAKRQLDAAMDASGPVAVIDGHRTGVRPFNRGKH